MRPDPFRGPASGSQRLVTAEGPGVDETQILGAVLSVDTPMGGGRIPLEIFACRHTLPFHPSWHREVTMTLQTTRGPVELRGELP